MRKRHPRISPEEEEAFAALDRAVAHVNEAEKEKQRQRHARQCAYRAKFGQPGKLTPSPLDKDSD